MGRIGLLRQRRRGRGVGEPWCDGAGARPGGGRKPCPQLGRADKGGALPRTPIFGRKRSAPKGAIGPDRLLRRWEGLRCLRTGRVWFRASGGAR